MARTRPLRRRSVSRKKQTTSRAARTRAAARVEMPGLAIENNRLVGADVSFVETPNKGGDISPRYLVFHYTAGKSAQSSIDWLTNPEAKASAHLVLARDGSICQLAPFNIKTWHAGISYWDGLSGLNSCSIGIEMDNAGPLKKVGDKYQAWFGALYAEDEVLYANHKFDEDPRWWHAYTEIKIQRA
ncbi:MAG: N-acetylmuramoyl-L-alanine amidase, partial [Nitrospirota bacterium]|nr:N-acetylmuramoyl-L-alanine amidase [Nitrospirota bacterium]